MTSVKLFRGTGSVKITIRNNNGRNGVVFSNLRLLTVITVITTVINIEVRPSNSPRHNNNIYLNYLEVLWMGVDVKKQETMQK